MPSRNGQFRIQPVSDGSPAGRERFLQDWLAVNGVDLTVLEDVHGAAQGGIGIEFNCMRWRDVYANRLCGGTGR